MAVAGGGGLFGRLRDAAADDWAAYTGHDFVRRLADGSLPDACFRHYLAQDYLFLIQFARAFALAAYKADDLAGLKSAAVTLQGILEVEMDLHVRFSQGWGLSREDMERVPEATACLAYTRFVLERGLAGDILDLQVALAPCVIGYGEIGRALAADPATRLAGNPYREWIETYAGADYQAVAAAAKAELDRLSARRLTSARLPDLVRTFRQATRLEAAFWQMGLDLSV